jgi:hypothetical protein
MRSDAHRPVATGNGHTAVVVASSPDSDRRTEPWLWDIRLVDGAAPAAGTGRSRVSVPLGGGAETLEVTVDPQVVRPGVELVDLTDGTVIDREERGLLALLVVAGRCLVEGRHDLGVRDTMVLEGDDPLQVSLAPAGTGAATVAIVRLQPSGSRTLGWVP